MSDQDVSRYCTRKTWLGEPRDALLRDEKGVRFSLVRGGERRNASEITFQFRIGHFLEPESAFDSKNRAKGFPKAMPWADIKLGLRPEWFS